ncbi:conserved exported hypothetical protein [Planktothrix sp. PCC 11201]|uniref:hypothetical protein n=1 Tax=Planktothrix sp. PCC 11201 TaxID=1729650 RepID=UPI000922A24D|nr:hypothetical protein [Planktothrix sp. PCC 11201]SKB13475.1 conserved exported hypothetical protein [Planktothrix sp. PCC 11201]
MLTSKLSRSGLSVFLALGLTTAVATPLLQAIPATAQAFPNTLQRDRILAGTQIPVEYSQAEKIVVMPNETVSLTITVAQDVVTSQGRVWIPAGAEIVGQLQPASGGSQFVASEVIISAGKRFRLDANSQVVTHTETVRKGASAKSVIGGAAIGAAAAAAIGAVAGDNAIATEEVLVGAGLGAITGVFVGRSKVDVVVINPSQDLSLTVQSDIIFR